MPTKKPMVKTKSVMTGGAKITKTTVNKPGLGGKSRSVTTEKPGETSTKTNMGPIKQAAMYRREIKKNK